MTGFSISSTWMLPLLLLPIFCCKPITYKRRIINDEFSSNVERYGELITNCSQNCSSVHITKGYCRCINLTLSAGECGLPHYINYLKSLYRNTTDGDYGDVKDLVENLDKLGGLHKQLCTYAVTKESIRSPKKLHEVLHNLTEIYSSLSRR